MNRVVDCEVLVTVNIRVPTLAYQECILIHPLIVLKGELKYILYYWDIYLNRLYDV